MHLNEKLFSFGMTLRDFLRLFTAISKNKRKKETSTLSDQCVTHRSHQHQNPRGAPEAAVCSTPPKIVFFKNSPEANQGNLQKALQAGKAKTCRFLA